MKHLTVTLLFITIAFRLLAQNKPLTILPFELKNDNRIYIKCRVNQSDTLTFLFDTGSGAMVINESILGKKLNLVLDSETNNMGADGENKVKESTKNKLFFGNIEADTITYLAIKYGEAPFDGVFGNNIMKDYIIEINYHKKLLYFYNIKDYVFDAKQYDQFDLSFISGVPVITASLIIDNKKVKAVFEMDTGGDSGLLISDYFSQKYHIAEKLKQVAKAASFGSDGVKTEASIVIIPEAMLGKKHFYRIPSLLSGAKGGLLANQQLAGIFGNAFLKRFDMILDIRHNKIFLKPNDYLYTPYYGFLVK
jgi:hypothetical protein